MAERTFLILSNKCDATRKLHGALVSYWEPGVPLSSPTGSTHRSTLFLIPATQFSGRVAWKALLLLLLAPAGNPTGLEALSTARTHTCTRY